MTSTGVNWASRPAMKLVADVYNGPGPASTYEAADAWRALSAGLAAAETEFAEAMKLARGNWEGPAADTAQAALAPISAWATTAGAIANALSAEAAFNADAFSATKAAMPSPEEVAAVAAVKDNPVDKVVGLLTAVPTPGEVAESVAAAQQAQAAIAMTGYEASTGLVDSYLTLEAPPPLSTAVISGNGASQLAAAPTSAWTAQLPAAGSADGSGGSDGSAGGSAESGSAESGGAGSDGAGSDGAASVGRGPTGGSSAFGDMRGTHSAGSAGSTAASPGGVSSGGGSAPGGTGAGSHGGGSQSIGASAGLGAGAGALGLGASRGFSGEEALRRSKRGLAGTRSTGGGVSGSTASTDEDTAPGPLSASSTGAVGVSGETVGTRAVGAVTGSAAPGGRGSGDLGAGSWAGHNYGQNEDEDEHAIPDYLKDLEHFTDGRVVAPPVIGADDAL